jgi:hypothetical protein
MHRLIFIALICLTRLAYADSLPVPIDHVEDGVYTLYSHELIPEEKRQFSGYFQTTILELKDGQFRYWFRSDYKPFGEQIHYPLTGTYAAKEGTVTIVTKTGPITIIANQPPREFTQTYAWKLMTYQGKAILWPALMGPPQPGKIPHGVLVRTNRKPEEIWKQESDAQ